MTAVQCLLFVVGCLMLCVIYMLIERRAMKKRINTLEDFAVHYMATTNVLISELVDRSKISEEEFINLVANIKINTSRKEE